MSKFFINRPIFASVLSIIIVIAGLVASQVLPIAQYPQIAPPTVLITATYPGASAETLARTVAAPIEEQLNGVENLLYFTSSASANGAVTITATFEVGTNVDIASVSYTHLDVYKRQSLHTRCKCHRSRKIRFDGQALGLLAGLCRKASRRRQWFWVRAGDA